MLKHKGRKLIAGTALACVLGAPGIAAADAEMDALKRQIDQLQRQLNDIQARQATVEKKQEEALTEADLKGSMPGSIRIPGTSTSLKIGGYVKLDGTYDMGPSMGSVVTPDAMPLDGTRERDGAFGFNARQTRLNVTTETPFDGFTARSVLEIDFYGSGGTEAYTNSVSPRLRHAYITAGPFTIGQTWTTAYDLVAAPEKLDFGGLPAELALRQPQVRYTHAEGAGTFSVALENPESDFIGNVAANNSNPAATGGISGLADPNFDRLPDLTVRYAHKFDWGHLAGFAIAREITADTATADDSVLGWGVGLSGSVKFLEKDKFGFQALYGEGVNRYMTLSYRQSASFDGTDLDALPSWGGTFTVQHHWDDMFRSNVTFAYHRIENNSTVPQTANKEMLTFHGNIIAAIIPALDVGLEYSHAQRETEGGQTGSADRLQASVMYKF
ncbi:DcaP family trimeric outer membrane transporter [Zavarzinia compransoris]|uniref:Uncharacterized protein n=1 Tax=Zavarzinia compransoris TaxID=1264899 RepID=A0A317E308_9PROT|nr:DcaP family trimeric outer membrane transporter [Zavarzinia compransoris]PWR20982.1 hypothetical protein DKG75_13415 [Zavarzinia compransoris]TDP44012.1 porin-like protein [Zavarzinia compransoris]